MTGYAEAHDPEGEKPPPMSDDEFDELMSRPAHVR